eukprot:CAMPEP_0168587208 /NCGR_PEP_ID=MMETSP0420-20121227/4741_1 /TAXON_ID=498008 /ORGANISM="Pessonella sp." /LENGTH=230 /DNA_ID=CAMNT_0008622443 /DNA_START=3 /DNA_END=695 /DNA_ORIENTATION=-
MPRINVPRNDNNVQNNDTAGDDEQLDIDDLDGIGDEFNDLALDMALEHAIQEHESTDGSQTSATQRTSRQRNLNYGFIGKPKAAVTHTTSTDRSNNNSGTTTMTTSLEQAYINQQFNDIDAAMMGDAFAYDNDENHDDDNNDDVEQWLELEDNHANDMEPLSDEDDDEDFFFDDGEDQQYNDDLQLLDSLLNDDDATDVDDEFDTLLANVDGMADDLAAEMQMARHQYNR